MRFRRFPIDWQIKKKNGNELFFPQFKAFQTVFQLMENLLKRRDSKI